MLRVHALQSGQVREESQDEAVLPFSAEAVLELGGRVAPLQSGQLLMISILTIIRALRYAIKQDRSAAGVARGFLLLDALSLLHHLLVLHLPRDCVEQLFNSLVLLGTCQLEQRSILCRILLGLLHLNFVLQ